MTTTVTPLSYTVTAVGASFQYGVYQVTANGVVGPAYPAHFVNNASGALVNPATDDTLQQLLAAINALLTVFQNGIALDAGAS